MSFRLAILIIDRLRKVGITSLSLDKANKSFGELGNVYTLKSQNKIYTPKHIQFNQMLQQHGFIKLFICLFESKNNIKEKLTMVHH